jgi:hypothetical protein
MKNLNLDKFEEKMKCQQHDLENRRNGTATAAVP